MFNSIIDFVQTEAIIKGAVPKFTQHPSLKAFALRAYGEYRSSRRTIWLNHSNKFLRAKEGRLALVYLHELSHWAFDCLDYQDSLDNEESLCEDTAIHLYNHMPRAHTWAKEFLNQKFQYW